MTEMLFTFLVGVFTEAWHVLVESAPYMLLGFFFAGLIKGFVPDGFVAKALGRRSAGSVVRASLVGVPLPLCSCSVLPTALGLRRQGASKGATTAFLISTPETGVDSIAVTYALLGPFMAVIRPVAAFISATFAGILADRIDRNGESDAQSEGTAEPLSSGGCSGGCCRSSCSPTTRNPAVSPSPMRRFRTGMRFAFGEMAADIGLWFLVGTVVAGVIGHLIPAGALSEVPGGEWGGLLAMLIVGLPLYVCASTSTPIAASLMFKGLSPGAALVFLLAGPATNGATLTVILKLLGRRIAVVYVASIAGSALVLGWMVNRIAEWWGGAGVGVLSVAEHSEHGVLGVILAGVLLAQIGIALAGRFTGHGHGHGPEHEHGLVHDNGNER